MNITCVINDEALAETCRSESKINSKIVEKNLSIEAKKKTQKLARRKIKKENNL